MIEDGRNYKVYINYTLLNFPKIISKILPFALFFSFTYVLARYELNNELVIFWIFGVNKISLVNFFFFFSLLMMMIQIIFTAFVVPSTQDHARSFLRSSDVDIFDNYIRAKKFNDNIKGLTIYAESKDLNDNLLNIYIKKSSNNKDYQITYAKSGKFKNLNSGKVLVLFDGETISIVNNKFTKFSFSKSDFRVSNLDSNTTTYIKTQETTTSALIRCLLDLSYNENKKEKKIILIPNCSYENKHNIFKELYKRMILPLYLPILILISMMLIVYSKEKINYLKYRIFIFLIGLTLIIISESTLRFIQDTFYANIKMIIIPLIILITSYLFLFSKFRIKQKI
jgi:lipopolysaccharide export system permease protein